MTTVKTSGLEGAALNWAVAKAEGDDPVIVFYEGGRSRIYKNEGMRRMGYNFEPSKSWSHGGPIIEREDISFRKYHNPESETHGTYYAKVCRESVTMVRWLKHDMTGPTPLIAAMRCYVASKLGFEIELPEELQYEPSNLSR